MSAPFSRNAGANTSNLSELEDQLTQAGVPLPPQPYGKKELIELLKQFHWNRTNPGEPVPTFVKPMLLRNSVDLSPEKQKELWDSPDYFAEHKRDGLRCVMHFDASGKPSGYSRNATKETYLPNNLTPAIFWMPLIPELADSDLDGEIISSVAEIDTSPFTKSGKGSMTKNVLQAATSLVAMENTKVAQESLGLPLRYVVYDVIKFQGKSVEKLPYTKRRDVLALAAQILNGATDKVELNASTNKDKKQLYDDIIGRGGEGIVFKHKDLPYLQDKRPHGAYKMKDKQELDCVVTGVLPPQSGVHLSEGLVGGLTFSCRDLESGEWHEVGASSAIDLVTRREISEQNPDGTFKGVKPGIIDVWIFEVEFRGWSKNYRMVHARPVRRRDNAGADSKSSDEATFDFAAVKKQVDSAENIG